ncbi:hypothetical protein [Streptosporangium roseum]|uniref:Uncharacterized protein n=1 Tax=Streptosporangium roseum (strain ATCC 12428 / DSM 43021 / JCM 3005 / KCTC 9067 / NCIMB 10171 / NRRL 2505 / NI 9100) TaxID=479432 RepID=D2B0N4_STRRD|nr:hypothetical protein [Streptosporangium roseum]ACZ91046.1 hypothetical protein Sros_8401 [Streptosporangium roseum DSM 43021]
MASGPHDPRSREWPADDGGLRDDTTPPAGSQEPQESPPTIQHSPPGPSDDSPRGLPLASPWMLPPFASPTPDDGEPLQARPEGLGGERRRPHTQPYASTPGRPSTPDQPYAPAPGRPSDSASAPGRASGDPPDRPPGDDHPAAGGRASGAGHEDIPPGRPPRPDLLVASGPPRRPGGENRPPVASDLSHEPGKRPRPDLLVASGPPRESRDETRPAPPAAPEPPHDPPDEPYGSRGERYGSHDEAYGSHDEPYGSRGERYGSHDEAYGSHDEPYGSRGERYGSHDEAHGSHDEPYGSDDGIRVGAEMPATPEPGPGRPAVPAQDDFEPVRRVGRPPEGRPARPDLLVAQGPPGRRGPNGGRHHRGAPAPSAMRRSSPTRRRRGRGLVIPFLMVLVLTVTVGGGLVLWGWVSGPFTTGLRLVGDEVHSGDANFVPPPGVGGDGSSQVLNAVASVGTVMVAVGSDTTSPVPRPLFLVSPDGGDTWRLGKVTGPVGYGTGPATVGLVAGGDGRWLAAGNDLLGAGRGLWTSADGHSWNAVDPGLLGAFAAGDKIMDLARTSSGFVAVGTTVLPDGTTGAVAWVLSDERGWERVTAGEGGLPDGTRGLKTVAAKGDAVVALGDPAPGRSAPAIARSADGGRTWLRTEASQAAVVPGPGVLAVAADGFVLVPTRRHSDKDEVEVYCSPQGADWARCGTIGGLAPDGSGVKRLASSPGGVAAITESGFERYAVYTSKDGHDWSKSTDLGRMPGSLRALAVSDEGTLVVGGDERAADVDNRLVLITAPKGGQARTVPLSGIDGLARAARETARVAAGGGRFVAVGAASGDAGIWTSTDGENWTAGGPAQVLGGSRRQALGDVAQGRRGWLAAGSTMTDASSTEPLLVTSDDGVNWRRVPVLGALAPAAEHDYLAPHAVAAGPSGYVLAGEDRGPAGTVPVVWFSPDLKRYTRAGKLPGGGGVRLHDVSATSSGYVAVGGAGNADHETGVVWVSADGVDWTARKPVLPPGATSAGLRHVVLHGGHVVAAGTARTGDGLRAFGAVSADNGTTWEFTWLPADQAAAVQDLAATEEGVVAVGWQGPPGEGDSVAWTSEDGLDWQRHTPTQGSLSGDGAQWLGAVAVAGGQVVALGRSTTYDADHLTLWRSTLTPAR